MHKENIKKVHIETVKIITETEKIIDDLIKVEEKNKDKDKDKKVLSFRNLKEDQEMLTGEKQKLDNLEYVVAVVGTMKAGKSMTINAIVGQEVLPSRELAMTTLPTLITHKKGQEKPILDLKDIEPFKKLVEKIKEKIENPTTFEQKDLNDLEQKDLNDLVEEIKNDKISFEESYEGQEKIENFLKKINDLMRIAKDFDIEPPYDDFTNVNELPRIEVEFYHLSKKEDNGNAKLTLLDTPGPDEFKHSENLKKVFKNQLNRASAVMLIVDYTKMNSQSDVEIKEQVKEVANMIGEQHLFVLVNKFDQKKESDDIKEKIKEAQRLIAKDILEGQINPKNICLISAKLALYANLGLREFDKNGKIDMSLCWIDDFGKALTSSGWQAIKKIATDEIIKEICKDSWKDSFLEEPLENIISTIHNDVQFLTFKSPIDKLENLLREYNNTFKIRQSSHNRSLDELKKAIKELIEDINNIKQISEDIEKKSSELSKETESKIERRIEQKIKQVSSEIVERFNIRIDEDYKKEKNKFHLIDFFKKHKKELNDLLEKGKVKFENKKDVENFFKPIKKLIDENIKNIYIDMEKQTNVDLKILANEINENIYTKLKDILKEIEDKLSDNKENKIEIQFPRLDIGYNCEINFNAEEIVEIEEVKRTKVKDSFLFGKIPNFLNSDWGTYTVWEKKGFVTKYKIQYAIQEQFNIFKDALINNFDKEFDESIKTPLKDRLSVLIKAIEAYRAEQMDMAKKKESSDREKLNQELDTTKKFQKKVADLESRVKVAKEELVKEKNGKEHG